MGKDNDMNQFRERFATDGKWNSFCLTADGCGKRYNDDTPFRENELKQIKPQRWNNVDYDENKVMSCMAILKKKGIMDLRADESVEQFIIRHGDKLDWSK